MWRGRRKSMRSNQWERNYFRMSTFFNTILYNITLFNIHELFRCLVWGLTRGSPRSMIENCPGSFLFGNSFSPVTHDGTYRYFASLSTLQMIRLYRFGCLVMFLWGFIFVNHERDDLSDLLSENLLRSR